MTISIHVRRSNIKLTPKANRVIARYFDPGDDDRKKGIIERILSLPDDEARFTLNRTLTDYSLRHRNISKIFNNNFLNVEEIVAGMDIDPSRLTREKQLLIGSYFTMEYAIESAAFFNPSIVEDPDQNGLGDGEKRVIASFRATGEGHISSVVFRSGIIDKNNDLQFKTSGDLLEIPETVKKHIYQKEEFVQKLSEMDVQIENRASQLSINLLSSIMQTQVRDKEATCFSILCAPPPPFIACPE